MPYDAKAVANEFLKVAEKEGKKLTPMQLIKLVYFAHGWHLALTGDPLINENVEAWRYGPVIPSLYHEFKVFGNGVINREATRFDFVKTETGAFTLVQRKPEIPAGSYASQLIQRVWDVHKHLSAIQLSNMTHQPDSPWTLTPGKEFKGTDIPNEVIKDYFRKVAERNAQPAGAGSATA